ncbi:MAG: CDP-alcohol phosphatidyltransferase family protein [Rhodospirillaceae bacterium]
MTETPEATAANALRKLDIEEATNRLFIHRISMALIPFFIHLGITPNTVSIMGALSGVTAAWFYFEYQSTLACILGFVCMIGWHIFDGADGQLARQTGQVSAAGFVIDGVCDYVTFVCVYVALGIALSTSFGNEVWFAVFGAGACHAVQAAAFEMQREFYIRWTREGGVVARAQVLESKADALNQPGIAGLVARGYKAVQEPFRPIPCALERELIVEHTEQVASGSVSRAYRAHFRSLVLKWSILSANNRTLGIFIFCLLGAPLAYFMYEIIVLNLVLFWLLKSNRSAAMAFKTQIKA